MSGHLTSRVLEATTNSVLRLNYTSLFIYKHTVDYIKITLSAEILYQHVEQIANITGSDTCVYSCLCKHINTTCMYTHTSSIYLTRGWILGFEICGMAKYEWRMVSGKVAQLCHPGRKIFNKRWGQRCLACAGHRLRFRVGETLASCYNFQLKPLF